MNPEHPLKYGIPDETAGIPAEWNLLVTAQEGAARDLKRFIRRQATFRSGGFRNVFLGWHPDPLQFLRGLADSLEAKAFANRWLGKAVPMQHSFPVIATTFNDDLRAHVAGMVEGLRDRSFHVRVQRRGHKGEMQTQELERRLGDFLWERLEGLGSRPVVSFRDPDVILALEIVGSTAGIGLISRQLRNDFAFVKVD